MVDAVKQQKSNEARKTGFQLRPENINRNGRPPKAWTMSSLIEEALEEVEQQSGKSFKHLVAKRLAHMAVGGDIQAIKEINDRVDGKPKQNLQLSGVDGEPIEVKHSIDKQLNKVYGDDAT